MWGEWIGGIGAFVSGDGRCGLRMSVSWKFPRLELPGLSAT